MEVATSGLDALYGITEMRTGESIVKYAIPLSFTVGVYITPVQGSMNKISESVGLVYPNTNLPENMIPLHSLPLLMVMLPVAFSNSNVSAADERVTAGVSSQKKMTDQQKYTRIHHEYITSLIWK